MTLPSEELPREANVSNSTQDVSETAAKPKPSKVEFSQVKEDQSAPDSKIMTFYNHSTDPSPRMARWSEFQDPVHEERRLRDLAHGFAVVHRMIKVGEGDEVGWATSSIEAKSPGLRAVLDSVFRNYPSWYADASPYAVSPPFKPYVHRWSALLEEVERARADELLDDELRLLKDTLEPRIANQLSALKRVKETGTVSFDDLWLILGPGCLIVSNDCTKAFRLVDVEFTPRCGPQPAYYTAVLAYVDWNGAVSGVAGRNLRIYEFNQPRSVDKLPFYPLDFSPRARLIEEKLLARGRKFEALRGFHVKAYAGTKYVEVGPGRIAEKPVCVFI